MSQLLCNFFPIKIKKTADEWCWQMKAKAMMGAIHKESPPEHWDNSMTTRTLLLAGIVHS
jgi:hypothetical protein